MRRYVFSSLRSHLGRLVAAAVAIVIGVAFATTALLVRSSAAHGVDESIGGQYKGVDAVVGPAKRSIQPADVATVKALPQAEAVVTITTAHLRTTWRGDVRPSYLAVEAREVAAGLPGAETASGRLPGGPGEIALPQQLAEKRQLPVGSKLTLRTGDDKQVTVTVVGIVADNPTTRSAALAAPAGLKAWDPHASPDEVRVTAAAGTTPAQLVVAIDKALPDGVVVLTGEWWVDTKVQSYTGGIDVLGAVFGGFAAIALFVAGLVIANTFTIVLAQRTRQLALLRCVGGSRRQVFGSVIVEAAVLGAVASAIGVLAGTGLTAAGLLAADRFDWNIPQVGLYADALALLVPLLIGFVATVIAAVVPARRATTVAPLAALRPDAAPVAASKAGLLRLVTGFVLLAGGGLLLAAGASGQRVLIGVAGGMISFLGVLAVGSLLIPALIRLIGTAPARAGGVPARIAVGNAVRNPRRTAATTSALLVGVTLISLTCVGIASVQKTFDQTLDAEYPVDLMVSAAGEAMPPTAERQLGEIDGITTVVLVRGATAQVGREKQQVTGVDVEAARAVVHGGPLATLSSGTAAVPLGMGGGTITVTYLDRSVRVRAVESDAVDTIVLTLADLNRLTRSAPVTGFWLDAAPKADGPDVIEAVEQSVPGVRELTVTGGLAERSAYTKLFEVLLIVAVALLAVSVLIALVGVGNTLSLSVLERTRENALLRALGLTRRQLRGMLAVESLLMALVAAGLGIGLGLVYGWLGTTALMGGTVDRIAYAVPAGTLLAVAAVATAAGLLASVLPARRAARVAPAGALATE